jgi:hypothetical protein
MIIHENFVKCVSLLYPVKVICIISIYLYEALLHKDKNQVFSKIYIKNHSYNLLIQM